MATTVSRTSLNQPVFVRFLFLYFFSFCYYKTCAVLTPTRIGHSIRNSTASHSIQACTLCWDRKVENDITRKNKIKREILTDFQHLSTYANNALNIISIWKRNKLMTPNRHHFIKFKYSLLMSEHQYGAIVFC